MRIFIITLWVLIYALPSSAVETAAAPHSSEPQNAENILSIPFETAMRYVAEAELEAPAASRIYALLALSLFNSHQFAMGGDTYKISMSQDRYSISQEELIEGVSETLFYKLFPEIAKQPRVLTAENQAAIQHIVSQSLSIFPLPEPIIQYSEAFQATLIHPEWRDATPLELVSASQFRAKGPPPFNSPEFLKALERVRIYGEDVSEYRLADGSVSAAFWGNPAGTMTPPGHWNQIAIEAIKDKPYEFQLELLLTLNIALYDSGIAAWDTKYHYNYVRPDNYIQKTDPDNPNWKAMGDTPHHPEYVSGHSAFSGAAAGILTAYFGDTAFCSQSKSMWGLERCFTSFQNAAQDAGQSRIYGGIHFDFSNMDGLILGQKVANHTLRRLTEQNVISLPSKASQKIK